MFNIIDECFLNTVKLKYTTHISDKVHYVSYSSDNKKEILAIQQYFAGVWDVTDKPYQTEKKVTSIFSFRLPTAAFAELTKDIAFVKEKKAMYDLSDAYVFSDNDCYAITKDCSAYVVFFDKHTEQVYYCRNSDNIENVLISQLIKDPLNIKNYSLLSTI